MQPDKSYQHQWQNITTPRFIKINIVTQAAHSIEHKGIFSKRNRPKVCSYQQQE